MALRTKTSHHVGRLVVALVALAAPLIVATLPAAATTPLVLYVNYTSSATTPCSSATPCTTIADALSVAAASSSTDVTINVAAGDYPEDNALNLGNDTLALVGAGAGSTAVGTTGGSVFNVESGTVTISGFEIDNGTGTSGQGGGVNNSPTTPAASSLTLTNDLLYNNNVTAATGSGGGIYSAVGTTTTLVDDTFQGNAAFTGGGFYNSGSATVSADTFSANSATDYGGGLYNAGSAPVTNSTFVNNTAGSLGAGTYVDGTGAMTNDTFSSNSLYNSAVDITLANSILYNSPCDGHYFGDGLWNVESDNSCGLGVNDVRNSTQIDLSPSLSANSSTGPETLAISHQSNAFEEVPSPKCTLATDERGLPRPGVPGQFCDAGAYELQSPSLSVATTGSSTSMCTSASPCSTIQRAITIAEGYYNTLVFVDVAAGTYSENDTINVPSGDTLIIQGANASTATVSGATSGDSVFKITGGQVEINDVSVTGGSGATYGGGVFVGAGTTTLVNDTISGNSATYGGGVYNAGSLFLTADTLSGNTAADLGGGLYNVGVASLTNDTLVNDAGTAFGAGGVYNGDVITLTNDTLSNDTGPNGGGVYSNSTTSIANSILDNAGCYTPTSITNLGYNVESDNSCGLSGFGTVNSSTINLAPSLAANGSSGPETLAIGPNSSAFEEVPSANCTVTTDERGVTRPGVAGANCDAGAFEATPATATLTLSDPSGSPTPGNNTYAVSMSVPAGSATPTESVVVTDSATGTCSAALTLTGTNTYTGSCTINSEAGSDTVTAHYNADLADPNYLEATSNTLSVLYVQTLTMAASATTTYAPSPNNTYQVTASTNDTDAGAAITYSVDGVASNTAGCGVNASSGLVTYTSAGVCTIDANSGATTNFAAASQAQEVLTVSPAAQAPLSVTSVVGTFGSPLTLTTSGGSGTGAVTYSVVSTGTANCSVTGDVLSAADPGTCVVTATKAASSDYLVATSPPATVTFSRLNTQITPSPLIVTSTSGTVGILTLTISGGGVGGATGALSFTLVTSGTAGCTLSGDVLSATSAGTCSVQAFEAATPAFFSVSSPATTVTFSAATTTTNPPPPPVTPPVTTPKNPSLSRTLGIARPGRSVLRVLGAHLYGQPRITSNAKGVRLKVAKDNGHVLTLIVTTPKTTRPGTYVMTVTFANGQRVRVQWRMGREVF